MIAKNSILYYITTKNTHTHTNKKKIRRRRRIKRHTAQACRHRRQAGVKSRVSSLGDGIAGGSWDFVFSGVSVLLGFRAAALEVYGLRFYRVERKRGGKGDEESEFERRSASPCVILPVGPSGAEAAVRRGCARPLASLRHFKLEAQVQRLCCSPRQIWQDALGQSARAVGGAVRKCIPYTLSPKR